MSSDFETLSCNVESSEGRRGGSISSDFDTLDDLVAEQDARLLRRLSVQSSSPCAGDRRAPPYEPSSIHSSRRELAVYGYRNYGVTGEVAATTPAARGSLGNKHSKNEQHRRPAAAQSAAVTTGELHVDTDLCCGDGGGGSDCGKAHLLAKDHTTCGRLPATKVASRKTETASWATGAATTPAAHASGSRDGEPGSAAQGQATCPPDSGTPTPLTSAAAMASSAIARRTHGSADSHDCEDDRGVEEERVNCHDDQDVQLGHPVVASAAASCPPHFRSIAPLRCSARDLDGFYNTGLLLEDDDDDEATESGLRCGDARAVDSAAAPPPSGTSGTTLSNTHGAGGQLGNDAPICPPRSQATTTVSDHHAGGHRIHSASLTSPNALTVRVPYSLWIASQRKAAGDQLCRLAVALPTMTAVHWLSLVITLLVPVNLLCLDVMALGWIRRRVDLSYGGASALPPPGRSAAPTPSRVGICGGAGVSTAAAAASPSSCSNGSGFASSVGTATDLSTSVGGSGCSTCSSDAAGAGNSGRVGTPRPASSSGHTVPALCSVILWLLAPNGLLCRLFIYRYRRPGGPSVAEGKETQDKFVADPSPSVEAAAAPSTPSPQYRQAAADTDEYRHLRAEWQACRDAYECVRRLAPQLEVIELFVRYACLWVMVHAALPCGTAASEWTEAWLLKAPAPEEEAAVAQNGSDWRTAIDATAPAPPRRAADTFVAA
ncbi:hypothetical protein GH5_08234 [Leishmania sp. Ghana 2012 LV757]|uniref:hypothetical protein n=1 Tax=Leishmania sp. Ghana 2012 LV757 TaxID=2803181 RepID=UPI001B4181AA|nr:hypothetical protein GH5_08234 [Leishmania sp. Ghana 2012 LV757]